MDQYNIINLIEFDYFLHIIHFLSVLIIFLIILVPLGLIVFLGQLFQYIISHSTIFINHF